MLFSVLVANYNNGQYLPVLIESLYNQTYPDWELILVDDCSSEDTYKYIGQHLNDKRVVFIKHSENKGAGAAFKTAADNARGQIMGMLGADDALMPKAIEKMVTAHQQFPRASLINSHCYLCNENLEIQYQYPNYKPLETGQALIRNLTVGSFATFKTSAYFKTAGFDPFFKRAVDHDIYLKLDEVGELKFVDEPLYLYRKNLLGISQNDNGIKAAQFSILARRNAYIRRKSTSLENLTAEEIKLLMKKWYLNEIFQAWQAGDKKVCNGLLLKSIQEFPSLFFNKHFMGHLFKNNFGVNKA